MSYYVHVYGAMEFRRPLTFAEIRELESATLEHFELVRDTYTQETQEGRLEVITASAICPAEIDERRDREIEEELEQIVRALPTDVMIDGEFRIEGEATGDISRLILKENLTASLDDDDGWIATDRKIERWRPRLVWPDGKEETYGER